MVSKSGYKCHTKCVRGCNQYECFRRKKKFCSSKSAHGKKCTKR